ncbi:MAG: phosphoenolpyruvate--protein phosphotransferase [Bacillota bacterium]|nr:phosphoenolpyruvate--protein phosphotransferase [Bacillota bacterium]
MIIKGIAASNGISIGEVLKLHKEKIETNNEKIYNIDKEIEKLDHALLISETEIKKIRDKTVENIDKKHGAIFDAHLEILKDPELYSETVETIKKKRVNSARAFQKIVDKYVNIFKEMDNEYMRERAGDILDVSDRVLAHLLNIEIKDPGLLEKEVIIVAEDLTPTDTASLNKRYVKGFATEVGGRTGHSAIMARTLEIPAVVGTKKIMENCSDGDTIIIDGKEGLVILNPDEYLLKEYKGKENKYSEYKEKLKKFKNKESKTKDGKSIELAGNIGSPEDVEGVLKNGGEGVGLYRTEFLFMGKQYCPSEEEQFQAYKIVLEKMKEKPVIIRTLDIGGDKSVEYMDNVKEMNPFLGHRAIRLCLEQHDIFKEQIRALLRASIYGNLKIMFPMIATIEELRDSKKMIETCKNELAEEGIEFNEDTEVGIMIEVPSAALLADQFAKEVDFFSIGTNDLIQYTFAADRMNEKVSYLYQPYNPALLRLIKMIVDASHKEGKWTGMCGEIAGNEKIIPILVGLGLDELSMSASSILKIREVLEKIDYKKAKIVAEEALNMKSNKDVEDLLEENFIY